MFTFTSFPWSEYMDIVFRNRYLGHYTKKTVAKNRYRIVGSSDRGKSNTIFFVHLPCKWPELYPLLNKWMVRVCWEASPFSLSYVTNRTRALITSMSMPYCLIHLEYYALPSLLLLIKLLNRLLSTDITTLSLTTFNMAAIKMVLFFLPLCTIQHPSYLI